MYLSINASQIHLHSHMFSVDSLMSRCYDQERSTAYPSHSSQRTGETQSGMMPIAGLSSVIGHVQKPSHQRPQSQEPFVLLSECSFGSEDKAALRLHTRSACGGLFQRESHMDEGLLPQCLLNQALPYFNET